MSFKHSEERCLSVRVVCVCVCTSEQAGARRSGWGLGLSAPQLCTCVLLCVARHTQRHMWRGVWHHRLEDTAWQRKGCGSLSLGRRLPARWPCSAGWCSNFGLLISALACSATMGYNGHRSHAEQDGEQRTVKRVGCRKRSMLGIQECLSMDSAGRLEAGRREAPHCGVGCISCCSPCGGVRRPGRAGWPQRRCVHAKPAWPLRSGEPYLISAPAWGTNQPL
jgi:hypothetical protein